MVQLHFLWFTEPENITTALIFDGMKQLLQYLYPSLVIL